MSSVNSVSKNISVNSVSPYEATSESTSVSASGNYVLEFARARSGQINSWLDRQLGAMRASARDTEALNQALATLAQYSDGFEGGDPAKYAKCVAALNDAIAKLPEGSEAREKMIALRDKNDSPLNSNGKGGRDDRVSGADMGSVIKEVENVLKAADRSSQEGQLMINQKMGERNEIMQLAAMLIQQFHETSKAVLQRS